MQRPAHRADRAGEARGDVGAGGGDDPGGERGGVHAVLGRGDPVGVDRLHVPGVGLAAPADHEPLDHGAGLVDLALRHHRPACPRADWAMNDSAITDARARSSRACAVVDVQQRPEAPHRSQLGQRALHVDADVAGVHGQRERLGRRQPGVELVVHEQAPHVAEGHPPDQVVDVDPAVAKGAALPVGFGDLRLEGDDALQPRSEVRVLAHVDHPIRARVVAGRVVIVHRGPRVPCRGARTARHHPAAGEPGVPAAVRRVHPRGIGSQMAVVAIGLQVYAITGTSFAVGLVGLFALVPLVVSGLYGGALSTTTTGGWWRWSRSWWRGRRRSPARRAGLARQRERLWCSTCSWRCGAARSG